MRLLRQVRGFFGTRQEATRGVFPRQVRAFDRAYTIVGLFYACNLFAVFQYMLWWRGLSEIREIDPLWPVFWVPWLGIETAVHGIMATVVLGALAAAFLPHRRSARISAFLGLFLYHALLNSFGKIGHAWHAWILCALLLIFLPDGARSQIARSRAHRQRYLNAFWSAQAMQLVFYSMAGFHKITGVIPQMLRGEVHSFAPEALSYHIAHRLAQTESESILGEAMIAVPSLGWLPFLFAMYLQAFALWVAFRPSIQRPWALGLISFHFVTYLTMDVSFAPSVLLLGLFFLCSPFAPVELDWRRGLRDMPLFGSFFARWARLAPEAV